MSLSNQNGGKTTFNAKCQKAFPTQKVHNAYLLTDLDDISKTHLTLSSLTWNPSLIGWVLFSYHKPMKPLSSKNLKRRSNQKKVRPVRCIDTGVVYASCSDASDILMERGIDVCPRGILSVCQGILKKTGGLRWEYAE